MTRARRAGDHCDAARPASLGRTVFSHKTGAVAVGRARLSRRSSLVGRSAEPYRAPRSAERLRVNHTRRPRAARRVRRQSDIERGDCSRAVVLRRPAHRRRRCRRIMRLRRPSELRAKQKTLARLFFAGCHPLRGGATSASPRPFDGFSKRNHRRRSMPAPRQKERELISTMCLLD